jgi:hypothetical protein
MLVQESKAALRQNFVLLQLVNGEAHIIASAGIRDEIAKGSMVQPNRPTDVLWDNQN